MLVSLSSKNHWEFFVAIARAWEWTQDRSRFYQHAGARMTPEEYFAFSRAENKKQIAVMHDGQMCALITVWLMANDIYDVHVVAPRRSKADVLLKALLAVRNSLFDDLKAEVIRTSCGIYRGHAHRGIRRILEACGMTPIGDVWRFADDDSATFQEYQISRDDYAKSKKRTNE